MDTQQRVTEDKSLESATSPDAMQPSLEPPRRDFPTKPELPPLRRVLVPIEKRQANGDLTFQTIDHTKYVRDRITGAIKRVGEKPRNKKERRKQRQAVRWSE